jgi:hypothetical protein
MYDFMTAMVYPITARTYRFFNDRILLWLQK